MLQITLFALAERGLFTRTLRQQGFPLESRQGFLGTKFSMFVFRFIGLPLFDHLGFKNVK